MGVEYLPSMSLNRYRILSIHRHPLILTRRLHTPIKPPPPDPPPQDAHHALIQTYPRSLRRLASLLPDSHTRPSKSDLLKLSNNSFDRLRIRWKWLTIRGFRKFNADEWSALVSWILVGHLGWLVLGTTTFVGMVLWTANSLDLQGILPLSLSHNALSCTRSHVSLLPQQITSLVLYPTTLPKDPGSPSCPFPLLLSPSNMHSSPLMLRTKQLRIRTSAEPPQINHHPPQRLHLPPTDHLLRPPPTHHRPLLPLQLTRAHPAR